MQNRQTVNDENAERTLWQGLAYLATTFWKYRFLVLTITIVTTLGTVAFVIATIKLPPEKSPLPNIYTAEATILVLGGTQSDIAGSILTALGIDQRSSSAVARDNGDMIIEILHSRLLLDRLVDEFKLADKYQITQNVRGTTRKIVMGKSKITYDRAAGSLKIAYTDIDPVFAQSVANRMVSLLDEWFSMNRGLAKQKQRQILEEKINEVKSTIDSLQNRIKRIQTQYGVIDVQGLSQSQAATIAGLRSQLILKEIDIANYSSFSKIDDPRLVQLKEERQNLLDLINQNQLKLPDSRGGPEGDPAPSDSQGQQKTLLDVAQEFSQLTVELDIQQRIYNTLSPQYEAMKLAPETEPAFQVLELADVPDIKSGPQRTQIILMAFLVSLAGGLALALFLNTIHLHRQHQSTSPNQDWGVDGT